MTNTRSKTTDEQKARIYAALQASNGNVKGTARELNMSSEVVRYWARKWEREPVPGKIKDLAAKSGEDFLVLAVQIRDDAMRLLHTKLPDASPKDLVTIVGVLSDKIRVAENMVGERREAPPAMDYRMIAAQMEGLGKAMLDVAEQRARDISQTVEGEATEVGLLELVKEN